MKYTPEEVMQFVQEEDVKFIRLAFCDVYGKQHNVAIMPSELKRAFAFGIAIDASAIDGFGGEIRSDLLLHPDASTLIQLPWRPEQGKVVQMFCDISYPDGRVFERDTRSILKKAVAFAAEQGYSFAFGAEMEFYLFKVDENGELTGGISKFLGECKDALVAKLGLKPGSFVCMAAGKKPAAQKTAGVIRTMLGKRVPGHFDEEQYAICWIVDFPMYEMGEESGQLEFCHNPFSMPQGGMQALLDAEGDIEKLLAINADQYDLVVNGYESASGAVRNHDPEIMVKAFQMVGLGEEDVKAKFPAMYNAFTYGAPPHAGAAPGVDRLIMLLTGEESIREVITFPMNKNAQDLMMGAPTAVDKSQLDTVHIALIEE